MKVLKKSMLRHVYRLRCIRCKSVLEMDDEERREWDLKYDESCRKKDYATIDERRNDPDYRPLNPMRYFDCPVCGTERTYSTRRDEHRYTIFEDGTEYMDY